MLLWGLWASDWHDWLYSGCGRPPSPVAYRLLVAGGVLSATLPFCIALALCAMAALAPRSRASRRARIESRHDRVLFFLSALPVLANWFLAATIRGILVATHSPK